jgi:hypothetical protein
MLISEWQTSTFCGEGNNCLGLAAASDGTIHLRESADPARVLAAGPDALRALLLSVKAGEFDHLAG